MNISYLQQCHEAALQLLFLDLAQFPPRFQRPQADELYKAPPIFAVGLRERPPQCHMRVRVRREMYQDDAREVTSLNHLEPDSWFYLN